MIKPGTNNWVADTAVGGVIGGILGAIVAVNFVIYAGIDDGYEATIAEVFRQNTFVGLVTIALLIWMPGHRSDLRSTTTPAS